MAYPEDPISIPNIFTAQAPPCPENPISISDLFTIPD